jgi:membrane-bound lytic murein transglycosylase B
MVRVLSIKTPALALIALILLLAACASKQAPASGSLGASATIPTPAASAPAMKVPAVTSSAAQPAETGAFALWLQGLRQDAAAKGISKRTLDQALSGVEPDQKVLDLDRSQPEFTLTFAQYAARTVTRQRIEQGRSLLDEYRPLLDKIAAAYGVEPPFIVALWGIESDYGRVTGGYSVISSLATLAYGSDRQDMFRIELIDALTILEQKNITPEAMTGSWAGAMGQCQFMPSSYLRYAVDYSRDGRRDIWTDEADVFASIANYLASSGWRRDQTWGRSVRLPKGFSEHLIGWKDDRPVSEWRRLGIRNPDGSSLSPSDQPFALVAPDGPGGPAWLTTSNYKVIMKWNRSTYFATSVGLLADGIAGGTLSSLGKIAAQ